MKLKLLIYKHASIVAQVDDDIANIVPYYTSDFVRQFIQVDWQIDVQNTSVALQNAPTQLFMPNDGKYDVVMFLFDRNAFSLPSLGMTFNVSTTLRGTYLACDTVDDGVGYTWKSMCHELLHSVVYKIDQEKNVSLPNYLDNPIVNGVITPYFGNENPYLVGGNFYQQLTTLKPYFTTSPNTLTAVLTRNVDNTYKETTGSLVVGNWSCKTLELSWLNNQPNISCIPKGNYLCKWKFKLNSLAYHYELQLVPNRSGIFIHAGNYAIGKKVDTQGCILLGASYNDLDGNGTPDIISSSLVLSAFEKLMNKADFWLTIK